MSTKKEKGDISALEHLPVPGNRESEDMADSNPNQKHAIYRHGKRTRRRRQPVQMYKSPRIGLTLHPYTRLHPSDRRIPIRFKAITAYYNSSCTPHSERSVARLSGGHDHCVNMLQISKKPSLRAKIASLKGMQRRCHKYMNTYQEGCLRGTWNPLHRFRGKGASSSRIFCSLNGGAATPRARE